ncbi:hypothetical protein [Sorangium sp. So ce1097]|uniref:hypothetical protein n=1 Tax=Sorangium sp. So ce1097 TaxID=3133330 RepID=UPI003F646D8E
MNTSISLFFGLMTLQTFGAGCTALVEVGDDSGDGGGREAGPGDDADGSGSSASGGGAGTGGGPSVSTGSGVSTGGGPSVSTGSGVSTGGGPSVSTGSGVSTGGGPSVSTGSGVSTGGGPSVSSGVGVGAGGGSPVGASVGVGTGGGPPVSSGPTGGGPGPATAGAIALLGSQLPDPSGSGSTSSAAGGPSPAPDELYVLIGSEAQSCTAPQTAVACGNWRTELIIPPASQVPGIYPLDGRYLTSSFYQSGPESGNGTCWQAGGTFGPGTLEIVSIDATEVVIRLSGDPTGTGEFDIDGEYTAIRCP